MTIATRGQGVGVDPPDSQQSVMIHSPGQQQLADSMSNLQIAESAQPESQIAMDSSTTSPPLESLEQQLQTDSMGPTIVQEQQQKEPDFPHAKLAMLDEKISSTRWVVPVLPDQELECLLQASIDLCKKGLDVRSEACQRFFREGLTISFTKILTDDAVNSWKPNIHIYINANCQRLIELIVLKLDEDWFPLLELLAMVFNPNNKFHTYNAARNSESIPLGSNLSEEELFAQPPLDTRNKRGWLVDYINKFGSLGGFDILLKRFKSGRNLTVQVIYALLKPFGLCYEFLTISTINRYFMPIVGMVPIILNNLTDAELKKEAKNESKNDAISSIIKAAKCIVSRVSYEEDMIKDLETLRLKMILRLLQISSFNGKMNALNEVNKVITSVNYYLHRNASHEEEEWLTAERMAKWIKENGVLEIVLRDSLHQPQYVEKLEKILRFIIKERALTKRDLDAVWAAQAGKHEAIVKNVHDLLAKLAWDFSPEQLDHLFECFQASWKTANKKQREKLLELIRRLAEDDKDGVMAHKVLMLFWNLAHSDGVPTEIMDQALNAHVKILDYSCSQERDAQKTIWLDKCVEELKNNDNWVLPALKQIREICSLYEPNPNMSHNRTSHHAYYRQEVIERLQNNHSVVILVTNSLTSYMDKVRQLVRENPDIDPNTYTPDNRYNHMMQVHERLNFLRFLLKDGQLWLCAEQAKQIWQCLAEQAVFPSDREACFKWFSKLMGDEPDLDPSINKDFFENNILQLDPILLTESGIKCFERFFKAVNIKEGKLKLKRRVVLMDDVDLIGADYLWRVVSFSQEEIANRGIEILKEVNTNLGPHLQASLMAFHENHIAECIDRLRAHYDTLCILRKESLDEQGPSEQTVQDIKTEAIKICRVMKVLQEYISECDMAYPGERKILPLHRAARGKHLPLIIRFANQARNFEDVEIATHTNETLGSLKSQILHRIKASNTNVKLDLYINEEILEPSEDRKLVSQIPLKEKMILNVKVSQANPNMPSSPDSSSDSSTSSPYPYKQMEVLGQSSQEAESSLPGVIMSQQPQHVQFFFQLADLGSSLEHDQLRDGAHSLLQLIPPDLMTVNKLQWLFNHSKDSELFEETLPSIESCFFTASPTQVLYNLEVLYTLLMPAQDPLSEKAREFQFNFMKSGEIDVIFDMLTKNKFLPSADDATKRSAYLVVLKLAKFVLTIVESVIACIIEEIHLADCKTYENLVQNKANISVLKQALRNVPSQSTECMLRSVAHKLTQNLARLVLLNGSDHEEFQRFFNRALMWDLPDLQTIRAIMRLAWATSSGNLNNANALHVLHETHENNARADKFLEHTNILVCKEALEVLTLTLVLNQKALEDLIWQNEIEDMWNTYLIDLVLLCTSRAVRVTAAEQFLILSTLCSSGQPLQFFILLLFAVIDTTVIKYAKQSHEYFTLLCRLINYAHISGVPLPDAEKLLNDEIAWLKKVRQRVKESGETGYEEEILEGHLCLTKELLAFFPASKKFELGFDKRQGINLIKELVEDFIFPASCAMLQLRNSGELNETQSCPVCTTPQSTSAAFDLLIALCTGCIPNMTVLVQILCDMFYSSQDEPLVEWDYSPPVGPRPSQGFVGLKNAGATCYMNSVLQQLFMVESIRVGLLEAEGAPTDLNEDFSGEERIDEPPAETTENDTNEEKCSADESRKEYNIGILKQVQAIFGHLAYSKLQYYIPRGLWKHFKMQGEPVNLREQQDAVEFFMSLVESLDEALKALGHEQIMSKILGGSYSDQKICKECPHRYSKEESFSVISVDIRNHSNLVDSLEQYVKGELLEGADAYHCDKCNKKVVTVKRLCVKKLPPILAIQLKRFEYDFERVCAIKFNDYFEFPRNLDMEPYTVSGLAKLEGEVIDCDYDETMKETCTKYQLTGIVVHSGQASGGHYYSFILHRQNDGTAKWYKFDDGEVSECKMDEEEEIKTQCFGGDYTGEVFDHIMKRMNYRRQKRWWNAYMLFYTRNDVKPSNLPKNNNELSLYTKLGVTKMPKAIEYSVRKQNIKFMHNRNQFNPEYFQFIRKLVSCDPYSTVNRHGHEKHSVESEKFSMLAVQLASKFLFYTGFRTKKNLRGAVSDWHDILVHHLLNSKAVRSWFAHNVLFNHPRRFHEYLLNCPSMEVRAAFLKIIVVLANFSLQDGPCAPPSLSAPTLLVDPTATLSDHLLHAVLSLMDQGISDHNRYLPHYFSLFHTYTTLGDAQKLQLLKLNVPITFMMAATDEMPGLSMKNQLSEMTKLYQVVSILIRCCDISSRAQSSNEQLQPLPNPYGDRRGNNDYLMPIQPQAADLLFNKTAYMKKMIEDSSVTEDTVKLLQYCSWENPIFSRNVITELLVHIGDAHNQDRKHQIDLLLEILLMEDSWQIHRVNNALEGVLYEQEGLFKIIQKSLVHHQKRAYQCIKCMVQLFTRCRTAHQILSMKPDLNRKWRSYIEWLQDELDKRPYPSTSPYTNAYNNWSPPLSNDSTMAYFLQRSNSAKKTLELAYELYPDEDLESEDTPEDNTEETEGSKIQQQQQQESEPLDLDAITQSLLAKESSVEDFYNKRQVSGSSNLMSRVKSKEPSPYYDKQLDSNWQGGRTSFKDDVIHFDDSSSVGTKMRRQVSTSMKVHIAPSPEQEQQQQLNQQQPQINNQNCDSSTSTANQDP